MHLCTLKCHTARHNEADIARAENDDLFAGQVALEVDVLLRRSCTVNACGASARNVESTAGTLAAAHGKNDRLCLELEHTALGVGSGHYAVGGDVKHHCTEHIGDIFGKHFFFVTPSVFGTCQLLAKAVQTKSVVNALLQNAAKLFVAFKNEQITNACLVSRQSRTHTGRTAANNHKIDLSHLCAPPFVFSTLMRD